MLTILLSILAIILVIGIVRICLKPSNNFFEFIGDLFLLDLLGDLLQAIIENIFDND